MGVVESLTNWGIRNAADVVELAAESGLALNVAVALLEQESGGGHNVWGSDGVATGGAYVKGAEVTRDAYLNYRRLCDAGAIGSQGVGPVQLTSRGYQLQADALGGCWDPRANMAVGFRTLAGLMRAQGTANGIRSYNGSGAMADRYRDQMLAKAAAWASRLGSGSTVTPAPFAPSPVPRTGSALEDDLMAPIPLTFDAAGRFHEAIGAEAGGGSAVAGSGFVTFGSTYGGTTWTVAALGEQGVLDYWPNVRTTNNTSTNRALPPGTRSVTVEGIRDNDGTRPWASAWSLR